MAMLAEGAGNLRVGEKEKNNYGGSGGESRPAVGSGAAGGSHRHRSLSDSRAHSQRDDGKEIIFTITWQGPAEFSFPGGKM